ncbi:MAG: phosphotransferase [Bacteroidales bacterium]|nr:phosphotransferase [Bacteroidales bacterium]
MKEKILELFVKTFDSKPNDIVKISADGSNRRYYRCVSEEHQCIAAYNEDRKENEAFISYAIQLKNNEINVPELYAVDMDKGIYLQEDLGDETLFSYLQKHNEKDVLHYYEKVVEYLPKIQTVQNFDYSKAYPRKKFDEQSIQWDLSYFKYYFLKLADIPFDEQSLENDFKTLENYLLSCETEYFLYRDFQSRNIMLKDEDVFFIDFQGARKGALQYDIASLLYDAKANLSTETREHLFHLYIQSLKNYLTFDEKDFTEHYYAYIYIRIMQAMGAYGYRGFFQKKEHFLKSIPFALKNIEYLENNITLPIDIPELHKVFVRLIQSKKLQSLDKPKHQLTVNIKSFSYKKGYPHDLSGNGGGFVFDCRALPNPGREERFKQLTGMDKEVKDFLSQKEEVAFFLQNVENLVMQSVRNYLQRGFTNLSVYFGCTGGQHRSVYSAEYLSEKLSQIPDLKIIVEHIEQNV